MLYVYAILEAPTGEVDAAPGFGGEPIQFHSIGAIAAAYSEYGGSSPASTLENLLRHEQVVESLLRDKTPLPARFATLFPNRDAMHAALVRNQDRLLAGLRKVRGCVEMGVRATWIDAQVEETPSRQSTTPPASGRAYMLARLEEERRRRELHARAAAIADELHGAWMTHAIDGTRRVLQAPGVPMRGAYLVLRESVDTFRHSVRSFEEAPHGLRLLCTGPWPPYHFVPELDLSGARRD